VDWFLSRLNTANCESSYLIAHSATFARKERKAHETFSQHHPILCNISFGFMGSLAVTTMAMDPADPNVIFAGTGENVLNIQDSIRGAGVFKTTNGGLTWSQLPSTSNSNWHFVNRLAINPSNGLILLAATNSGIWRSTDGGTTWSNRLSTRMMDINFHPTDGNKCIASGFSGAFHSTDGGITWNSATGLPTPTGPNNGRIEV
jgi:photosystem II stability/assembly factor-like uncharacterized protein